MMVAVKIWTRLRFHMDNTVSESSDEGTESDEAYDEDDSDEDDFGGVDHTEIPHGNMASELSDQHTHNDDEGDSDVDDADQTEIEEETDKLCLPI